MLVLILLVLIVHVLLLLLMLLLWSLLVLHEECHSLRLCLSVHVVMWRLLHPIPALLHHCMACRTGRRSHHGWDKRLGTYAQMGCLGAGWTRGALRGECGG